MLSKKYIDRLLQRFRKEYTVQNWIEVSRSAVLRNYDLFARDNASVIPVLKGNAYGHGIEIVADILKARSMPYIAVDGYYEALRIRKVSAQPVLIMGAIAPDNFTRIKYDNFAFVVHDAAAINALGKTKKRVNIHLEINTGMNRYGARPGDVRELIELIQSHDTLTLEGVMSHLADSDGNPRNVERATKLFDKCVEQVKSMGVDPPIIHIAQTAGSVVAKSRYANAMRLGIGLYGINPFSHDDRRHRNLHELQPALSFYSTITQVTELQKGESVSYNYTYTAQKPTKIGVLPAGYYEGINRQLSNAGIVEINKHQAPIVGRVCMNHTMINLEGVGAKVGGVVTVYSGDATSPNSIDMIASSHGLFNYNLLTSLSPDIRRIAVD